VRGPVTQTLSCVIFLIGRYEFYMFCLWKYVTLYGWQVSRRVDKITSKQVISSMDNV